MEQKLARSLFSRSHLVGALSWVLIAAWAERHGSIPRQLIPDAFADYGTLIDLRSSALWVLVVWNIVVLLTFRFVTARAPFLTIPAWIGMALLWQSTPVILWSFSFGLSSQMSLMLSVALFWGLIAWRWNRPGFAFWTLVAFALTPTLSLDRLLLSLTPRSE
jgi:hypothetical protein